MKPILNFKDSYTMNLINPYVFSKPFDADAQAFIDAAGITNVIQKNALNKLVVDLKTYGIWSKCIAIYPILGGTATTHKYNLKDPRDLDAAFRLSFAGSLSHGSDGITHTGATGYCNTHIVGSNLINNNTHLSYYSNNNTSVSAIEMGMTVDFSLILGLFLSYAGTAMSRMYSGSGTNVNIDVSDSLGFYVSTRTASNVHKLFKAGSQIGSTNTNSNSQNVTSLNLDIYLMALNYNGSSGYNSDRRMAFASIGVGLSDTEAYNFNTIVTAYQTSLSR